MMNIMNLTDLPEFTGDKYKICVIYARVSSAKQLGIPGQISACASYASNLGFSGAVVFTDINSAWKGNIKRKGFTRLQRYLRGGNKNMNIFIHDVSRFSRDIMTLMNFLKKFINVTIHSIIDNQIWDPSDKQKQESFISMALESQKFSTLLSSRVKDSNKRRKLQGHKLGNAPYGKRVEIKDGLRVFTDDEEEIKIVNWIRSLNISLNYRDIAYQLNEAGIMKRCKKWTYSSVKSAYKSKMIPFSTRVDSDEILCKIKGVNKNLKCIKCSAVFNNVSREEYIFFSERPFVCANKNTICSVSLEEKMKDCSI